MDATALYDDEPLNGAATSALRHVVAGSYWYGESRNSTGPVGGGDGTTHAEAPAARVRVRARTKGRIRSRCIIRAPHRRVPERGSREVGRAAAPGRVYVGFVYA